MSYILHQTPKELLMQRRKWFRIFIYLMLIAMIASTLLVVIEPFLAG